MVIEWGGIEWYLWHSSFSYW